MSNIKIENIVSVAKICDALDVSLIYEKIPESSYNPEEFNGVSIKDDEKKTAAIILYNGKIVSTGAKTIEDSEKNLKKTIKKIKDIGFEIKKDYKIEIENIIVSKDLKKEMHLSSISQALILQNIDYQPEKFPGLIFRPEDLCAVVILFNTGKIVCTGTKNVDDAACAVNMMEEKLSSIGVL